MRRTGKKTWRVPRSADDKRKSRRGRRANLKGYAYQDDVGADWKKRKPSGFSVRINHRNTSGGQAGGDVEIWRDPAELVIHVECKNGRLPNIRAALEQAILDARAGCLRGALTRDAQGREIVSFDRQEFEGWLFDWLELER